VLPPLAQEAITRWSEMELTDQQLALLESVTFEIADLPGDTLGLAALGGSVVRLDVTAAGQGWFLDATPGLDEEFDFAAGSTQGLALPGSGAEGRIDLLTVLLHELGHIIGLEDIAVSVAADDLMTATLGVGVRRLPEGEPLQVILSPMIETTPSAPDLPGSTSSLLSDALFSDPADSEEEVAASLLLGDETATLEPTASASADSQPEGSVPLLVTEPSEADAERIEQEELVSGEEPTVIETQNTLFSDPDWLTLLDGNQWFEPEEEGIE
jgi:hypothetical protein